MPELTDDELELWHAWKQAAEDVRGRVVGEISDATGLSDPDFAVLTRIAEIGRGRLRQNRLAELIGYQRSRLSHHLSRMEERGLVTRDPGPAGHGVDVIITEAGREAVRRARPVHADAVRRFLIDPLPAADRARLLAILRRLSAVG
jgi:DNA-binding MarR family transcriptional regulator